SGEAGDRLRGFLDLGVTFGAAEPGGVGDAVFEVVVQQAEGDTFQGGGEGGDLGEDVDAVLLFLDHPVDAAGLALDPLEAGQVAALVADVAVVSAGRLGEVGVVGGHRGSRFPAAVAAV